MGAYLNYLQDRIRNGFNIDSPAVPEHNYTAYVRNITASYTAELVRRIGLLLCAGQVSAANQTLMVNALNATTVTAASSIDAKLNRVCAAVLMVMACSEYLVQK